MNKARVTRLAFAIVIVCFLLSTFVSLWSIRLIGRGHMEELSKVLAARIYDAISSDLSESVHVTEGMAHDTFLIDLLADEENYSETELNEIMRRYLLGLKEGLDYDATFVISEATHRYYTWSGADKIVDPEGNPRDHWYREFLEDGKTYALDVDQDELAQDEWRVFVNARIEDDQGNLLGVCGVGTRMTESQKLVEELEGEYGVKINLIDSRGLIQVDTDETRIETRFPLELPTASRSDYTFIRDGGSHLIVTKYVDKLDWTLVVQSDGTGVKDMFINIILLNIGLCLVVLVILLLSVRIIAMRTRALTNASFRDQTTQLLNRRAFEEEKSTLLTARLDENFVYVTADINGLKTVNDTLGHAAGDELIIGAAQCLKECFGRYGRIYRIGGDEFAAMLTLSTSELRTAMAALDRATAGWKGERVDSLSISCGYATSREHPSENLSELGRISDEMMYVAKEEHYRRTGKPRRGTEG